MSGVEVYVNIAGESFTLHRTCFYGGTNHYLRGGAEHAYESGAKSTGYAATNAHKGGERRWVFIPAKTLGSFERCEGGSQMEVKFSDVKVGPKYFDRQENWMVKNA